MAPLQQDEPAAKSRSAGRGSPSNGLTQLQLPPSWTARSPVNKGGSPGGTCSRTLVHADRSYAVLAAGVAAGQRRLHRPACRRLDESAISWRSARITGLPPDTARDVAYIPRRTKVNTLGGRTYASAVQALGGLHNRPRPQRSEIDLWGRGPIFGVTVAATTPGAAHEHEQRIPKSNFTR